MEYDIRRQFMGSLALQQRLPDSNYQIVECCDFREPYLVAFGRAKDAANSTQGPTRAELVRLATQLYRLRQVRSRFLPSSLFAEPAWDILLALYCLPPGKPKLSVSKLAYAAEVPATTALRWTQILESAELIERSPDPDDGRRFFVSLSSAGEESITNLLRSSWDHGLQDL